MYMEWTENKDKGRERGRVREKQERNKKTKERKGNPVRTENECQETLLTDQCLVAPMTCVFSSWACRFIGWEMLSALV